MKAAVFTRYGPPEVLQIQEVQKPIPKDNEVLVRVHATTVCAADWRLRRADPWFVRSFVGILKPKKKFQILGMEFSGVVESVGNAVTKFRAGDQVFGSTSLRFGAYAEYICMPEDRGIATMPVNMKFEEAAAVMFGGMSALCFLRKAAVQTGQKVLVRGASGSVGVFAVQLAKHFGAHVTGVCSTTNLELVKSLGADEVVDYTKEDFSSAGRMYDVIFDTVGAVSSRTLRALKRGGCYVVVGGPPKPGQAGGLGSMIADIVKSVWFSSTGIAKVVGGMVRPQKGDQQFLKGLIEAGKLRTVIDRRYSLEEIAAAHHHAETGHKRGHVVIVLHS